jgi:hypothetical protein
MARASRGQLGLVMGLLAGTGGAVGAGLGAGEGWSGALSAGIGTGVGCAILGATLVHGLIRRRTEAVGELPAPVRRAAGRASLRGPVPEDPVTRTAALALAENAQAEQGRRAAFALVGSLIVVAMLVNLAVQRSPWWWVGVLLAVAGIAFGHLVLPRQLRRRIDLLSGASEGRGHACVVADPAAVGAAAADPMTPGEDRA